MAIHQSIVKENKDLAINHKSQFWAKIVHKSLSKPNLESKLGNGTLLYTTSG